MQYNSTKMIRYEELGSWKSVNFDPDTFGEHGDQLVAFDTLTDYSLTGDTVCSVKGKLNHTKKKKKARKKSTAQVAAQKNVVSSKGNSFCVSDDNDCSETLANSEDLLNWSNIFVPEEISRSLLERGFNEPTEIQRLVIPAAIKGRRDILGAAETGSGKTLAFGIPMMYGIMKNLDRLQEGDDDCPKLWGLVLTPTRELAVQVKGHLEVAAKYTPIKISAVVGGLSSEKQSRLLSRKPHIIVATPGRLWDLIQSGLPLLSDIHQLRFLAVDETDRMLEKNHFPEFQSLLERINQDEKCKKLRQNFVFSATLTLTHEPPKYIKKKRWRKSLAHLTLNSSQKLKAIIKLLGITDPKIVDITNKSGTASRLQESRIVCAVDEKDIYLYYLLCVHPGRTLVFCNSIHCVRRLTTLFGLLKLDPLPLHSNMIQKHRLRNLERFSDGKRVLIATDVAARGLDIPKTDHVIHYQVARTSESYVHRSGRTARANNTGVTVALVSPEEVAVYAKTLATLGRESDPVEFPVESKAFALAREKVIAARSLDLLLLAQRRDSEKRGWLEHAAIEADLVIDDDLRVDEIDSREASKKKKAIAAAKRHLDSLLSTKLAMKTVSAVEKVSEASKVKNIKLLKKKKATN